MDCAFPHFCSCGRSGYTVLKELVDAYAKLGRSYEFRHCRMFPHCIPGEATVGFWQTHGEYCIYFDPPVSYQGDDGRLARFFSSPLLHFATFEDLVLCLMTLAGPPAAPPETMPTLYHQLKQNLQLLVLGQEHAVEAAAFKLYGHISKPAPARPLSLIFYGPTGVGKSELGKGIAPVLRQLHHPYQFVWTELNTFTEPHSVYRLIGAPPGYVGYEDQPIFEAVRREPRTVFMFDELEKAHPEVLKVFMSILDEGRCTAHREDSSGGRELDFRSCIFIFTTNADLSVSTAQRLGFSTPEASPTREPPPPESPVSTDPAGLARRLFEEDETARRALIRTGVLKEVAGRFSGLIGFHELDHQARVAVTTKQISALAREYGIDLAQVALPIAEALTPERALSLRSTIGVLEGTLTPLFLSQSGREGPPHQFRLDGTLAHMRLLPLPPLDGGHPLPVI